MLNVSRNLSAKTPLTVEVPASDPSDGSVTASDRVHVIRQPLRSVASTGELIAIRDQKPSACAPLYLRRSVSVDALFARTPACNIAEPWPRQRRLRLSFEEKQTLYQAYGAELVDSRLKCDVFADIGALRRQLAHESKCEIIGSELMRITPFALLPDQTEHSWTHSHGAHTPLQLDQSRITHIVENGQVVGVICNTSDGLGQCRTMSARGRFGVPIGWTTEDKLTFETTGVRRLSTVLTGPNGESGMVERSFDGSTLCLEKAYKSTLPTRINNVPGFTRSLSTINYLTARGFTILGVTDKNLQYLKVSRLQHLPTLAHLDWLRRIYPGRPLSHLIDHTTWARSYIRETAAIVGHTLQPHPDIVEQGCEKWRAAHSGAALRKWHYLLEESIRLTVANMTGQELPEIDDPKMQWRDAAEAATKAYKIKRCEGLSPDKAHIVEREIDTLLNSRIDAISKEERALCDRYNLSAEVMPRFINFDVTYSTKNDLALA